MTQTLAIATHITDKHIKIKCDCKKGYHLFGSSAQFHNRTEHRGMFGHQCSKYTDVSIKITDQTENKIIKNTDFSVKVKDYHLIIFLL